MHRRIYTNRLRWIALSFLILLSGIAVAAQAPAAAVERGSQTAKDGFKNEDEIRDKFIAWRTDEDARAWLTILGYDPEKIESVEAAKPSGDKSDVVVRIKFKDGTTSRNGISIKLVSSPTGFNQIDKRWLRQYAAMWKMPEDVVKAMRLYLGEDPPTGKSRRPERMFINEFDADVQLSIVEFFTANKDRIIADLIRGSGPNAADHFMVAWKPGKQRAAWKLVTSDAAIKFFGEGRVEITRAGNLKLGRITMQRKGGDGGRDTAKMLQFKLNPTQLFN